MSNQNSHLYQPLYPWQTRLIEVLPGDFDDELRCKLYVADIVAFQGLGLLTEGRLQQYEALSYTWGYPELSATVLCNGQTTAVTPALAQALQNLRDPTSSRWLWCDAICIDQSNNVEKSQQVGIMMLIFSKAVRVVAWLGIPSPHTSKLLRPSPGSGVTQRINISSTDPNAYELINAVRHNSWFTRMWVRQEVYAAKALILRFGRFEISPASIAVSPVTAYAGENAEYFTRHERQAQILLDACGKIDLGYQAAEQQPHTMIDLEPISKDAANQYRWLVRQAGLFDVSDDRDRVYAFVRMIDNQCRNPRPALEVDYTRTICLVYQDLTKHFINASGSLALLEVFYGAKRPPDWPSWTLDLRLDVDAHFLRTDLPGPFRLRLREHREMANGAAVQDLDRVGELVLKGIEMGRVSNRAHPLVNLDGLKKVQERWDGDIEKPSFSRLVNTGSFLARDLRIGRSETSRLGVCASKAAREGDLVVLLDGSPCPFILRETPNTSSRYTLVGACWLWYLVDIDRDSERQHHFTINLWLADMIDLQESEPGSVTTSKYVRFDTKATVRQKYTVIGPLKHEASEVGRAFTELYFSLNRDW